MAVRSPPVLLRLFGGATPEQVERPDPIQQPPGPPAGVTDAYAAVWQDVATVLVNNGSWRAGTEQLLRLYCTAVCEGADARAYLETHDAVLVTSKSGAAMINPYRTIAADAEAAAAKLAKMLGLVPGSRRA